MNRAVIYTRVSSKDQIDNTSLRGQEESCREWCARQGIEIVRHFTERGETAKTADRTTFQAMFRYLAQEHQKITHLVLYRLDRFSRDVYETGEYVVALRRYGIKLQSVTGPTDNTPEGRFVTTVLSAKAQLENENRSDQSVKSMKARANEGRWVWLAPLGFRTGRGKNLPSLLHDPDRAPLIYKFFQLVSEGKKITEALALVNSLGLKTRRGKAVTPWTAKKWLISPVYAGVVFSRTWSLSVKGDFDPIVSEELFRRVQDVLAGRSLGVVPHRRRNVKFPLKGTLICPTCGRAATALASRGKMKKKYGYYRCHRGRGHFSLRSDKAEVEFIQLLDRLQPKLTREKLIGEIFRRVWKDKQVGADAEFKALAAQEAAGSREAAPREIDGESRRLRT